METVRYAAVIESSADGYGVFFPDLPGCTSGGADLNEAITNAGDALALHLAAMREDGEVCPQPTPFDKIVIDPVYDVRAIALIEARQLSRKVRINVMMDASLLEEIDRVAPNRSLFLNQSARRALAET